MARKPNFRILAVDDDPPVLESIYALLGQPDREVLLARSSADVESYYDEPPPDMVLLDWRLPDGDGMEMLPALKQRWPAAQIVLMSGFANTEIVVEAIKRGAYHFKNKPFSGEDLRLLVDNVCALKQQTQSTVLSAVRRDKEPCPIVAESPRMQEVLRFTHRVATNDISILITGESGTGKEVIANLTHSVSLRARGPLVSVNCATLPGELIEAELFGVVKGAYTGAVSNRSGLIREAARGTLFLDEIAEMPIHMQAKLLRVLQQREFRPVGGQSNLHAECRIIAATNRDPARATVQGQLRADLFYRIGAITIHLPPLRERPEDILPLARHFIGKFAEQTGRSLKGLTPAAIAALQRFAWPGNVRQLENEIQRAVLLCEQSYIDVGDLLSAGLEALEPTSPAVTTSPAEPPGAVPSPASEAGSPGRSRLADAEKAVILAELKVAGGSKRAVARKLGIARQTLYNKLRLYGIETLPAAQVAAEPFTTEARQ